DATAYELSQTMYWPKLKNAVGEVLKSCNICNKNADVKKGGEIFVETNKPLQIAATDLFFIKQDVIILTFIDYFTRKCALRYIESKHSKEILRALTSIFEEIGVPEKLVTDSGKEFLNKDVKKRLNELGIHHHTIALEKHQANGRIERLHRDLWKELRKMQEEKNIFSNIEENVKLLEHHHNKTKHRALGMSPDEAWETPNRPKLIKMNTTENKYAKEFKKAPRETFEVHDKVYIQSGIIEAQEKINSRRNKQGVIIWKMDNDSYLVRADNKFTKYSHSQLKKISS
ncbi:hypothetical protein ENBRE01_3186, partial [Enteropsectra breve]